MVEYFVMPEVPGKTYFRCEKLRATLSTVACCDKWRLADSLNDGSNGACRLCPIGAVHAGEVAASMSPLKGTLTCARCHRVAGRLIGGHLDPSCYNREREAIAGRNAKGTAPVKLAPLSPRRLLVRIGDAVSVVKRARTADIDELVVATLRDSKKSVLFAWNSTPPAAVRQARLW